MHKITIIGTGYVGLVTAAGLAEAGNHVVAYDVIEQKITDLQNGIMPIYEPGLAELVQKNQQNKRLNFSNNLAEALAGSKACFLAVGTPHNPETDAPDLSYLYQAVRDILTVLTDDILLVNKSTAPLGTYLELQKLVAAATQQVTIAINPEFLSQGNAVKDFMQPKRIVVGVIEKQAAALLKELYQDFITKGYNFVVTSPQAAELIKYAANTALAVRVAFINEISLLAQQVDADIAEISKILTMDERIGGKFLTAGPGYGGSCFPKDTAALSKAAKAYNLNLPIISNINHSNELLIQDYAARILAVIKHYKLSKIAIFGLAFKAGTDDLRDSQAVKIIKYLQAELQIEIYVHDVLALAKAKEQLTNVHFVEDLATALANSELHCFLTESPEYAALEASNFRGKIIIDLRGIITNAQLAKKYLTIGGIWQI